MRRRDEGEKGGRRRKKKEQERKAHEGEVQHAGATPVPCERRRENPRHPPVVPRGKAGAGGEVRPSVYRRKEIPWGSGSRRSSLAVWDRSTRSRGSPHEVKGHGRMKFIPLHPSSSCGPSSPPRSFRLVCVLFLFLGRVPAAALEALRSAVLLFLLAILLLYCFCSL